MFCTVHFALKASCEGTASPVPTIGCNQERGVTCTVVLSECAWPEYSLTISTVDFSLFPYSRVEELGVLEVMVKLKRWPNTSLEAEATHGQKTRSSNPKYKYTSEH